MTPLRTAGAVLAAALAMIAAPTPVHAQSATTTVSTPRRNGPVRQRVRAEAIDEVKSRCVAQVARRQHVLRLENVQLEKAWFVPPVHRDALVEIDTQSSSGLASLAETIGREDNFQRLVSECRQIVDNYRVFVLIRARARLVIASDRELATVTKLSALAHRFGSQVTRSHGRGHDTDNATASLTTMRSAITTASTAAAGVYEATIHLRPADYNGKPALLQPQRNNVHAAYDSLQQALAAGRDVRQSLRGAGT